MMANTPDRAEGAARPVGLYLDCTDDGFWMVKGFATKESALKAMADSWGAGKKATDRAEFERALDELLRAERRFERGVVSLAQARDLSAQCDYARARLVEMVFPRG